MAEVYSGSLQGAYNPPGYAQPQYDHYYQQYPPPSPQYPSQYQHQQQDDDEYFLELRSEQLQISHPSLRLFFGALCYPKNDNKDLVKLKATADIGIFVGYALNRKGPEPILLTLGQISSGLVPNLVPAALYVPFTNKDLEILFQPMFDEYFETPDVERSVPPAPAVQVPVVSAGVAAGPTIKDNPFAQAYNDPFVNVFAPKPSSEESSSGNLATDALWCFYNSVLSKAKPKNFKTVVTEACWFEAMIEEIHEFDRLQVWELVLKPACFNDYRSQVDLQSQA
ncbi:hypothetical protein Tco_0508717 [Tanacetum coccineum]